MQLLRGRVQAWTETRTAREHSRWRHGDECRRRQGHSAALCTSAQPRRCASRFWGAAAERAVRGPEVSAFGVAPRSLAWARYRLRQIGVSSQIARVFYLSSRLGSFLSEPLLWLSVLEHRAASQNADGVEGLPNPQNGSNMQAVYYRDAEGREPVRDFIWALPTERREELRTMIGLLNQLGPNAPPLPFPLSSQVEGPLRELRCHYGRDLYRILYQRSENLFVLLHIVQKHTRALARADIEVAKERWIDFRARMDDPNRRPPRAAGHDAP